MDPSKEQEHSAMCAAASEYTEYCGNYRMTLSTILP